MFLSMALLASCVRPPQQTAVTDFKIPDKKEPIANDRSKLEIPYKIMKEACREVHLDRKVLGFNDSELERYPGSDFRLKTVSSIFPDVSKLPRYSGRISDLLLENPRNFDDKAILGFSILGSSSGRGITLPKEGWGVDWIPEKAALSEAFEKILEDARKNGIGNPASDDALKNWGLIPDPVRKLAVKLIISSIEADKILKEAYDEGFLLKSLGVEKTKDLTASLLYDLAAAPWVADEKKIIPRDSFEAMHRLDMNYLGFGSAYYLKYARAAMEEFREWKKANTLTAPGFTRCEFEISIGTILITGPGADEISGHYALVIDMGGDDKYSGAIASPQSLARKISVVVDISGNDTYDSGDKAVSLACGNHGLGAIFDLEGNDKYICKSSGIGCAWYGIGLVVDYSGNDSYTSTEAYSLGCGFFGAGMLIDLEGDDSYSCVKYSIGFGGTCGVGLVLDVMGNDKYKSTGELEPDVWGDNPVCMSMGAGSGRRADFGDGHSLAGGVGMLIEGAGDDTYDSFVFSLGTGYWWGLGIMEDISGNDKYDATHYSFGSGAHFALGIMADRAGDDQYCFGRKITSASLGEGRDGSIGVFFEAQGNDQYHGLSYRSAGNSDLNSIGIFWDRYGDDIYQVAEKYNANADSPVIFGSCCKDPGDKPVNEPIPNIGIFLDTAGKDTYSTPKDEIQPQAKNGSHWQHNTGPYFWSYGLDLEWFLPAVKETKEGK
jgi:hypothetical protein